MPFVFPFSRRKMICGRTGLFLGPMTPIMVAFVPEKILFWIPVGEILLVFILFFAPRTSCGRTALF